MKPEQLLECLKNMALARSAGQICFHANLQPYDGAGTQVAVYTQDLMDLVDHVEKLKEKAPKLVADDKQLLSKTEGWRVSSELSPTGRFLTHVVECETCRRVLDAYYDEMPSPNPLCSVGHGILEQINENRRKEDDNRNIGNQSNQGQGIQSQTPAA